MLSRSLHRLVWGLVHSSDNRDVSRGLRFAEELLRDNSIDAQDQRDLVYLTAVAMYRLGKVWCIMPMPLVFIRSASSTSRPCSCEAQSSISDAGHCHVRMTMYGHLWCFTS